MELSEALNTLAEQYASETIADAPSTEAYETAAAVVRSDFIAGSAGLALLVIHEIEDGKSLDDLKEMCDQAIAIHKEYQE